MSGVVEELNEEYLSSRDSEVLCDSYGNLLFEIKRSSKRHWVFVRLVAKKGSDTKTITRKDAIKASCRKDITSSMENVNSIYRHVEKEHKRKYNVMIKKKESEENEPPKKKVKTLGIPDLFSIMIKDQELKKANKNDQLYGEAVILKWISGSLRPFIIVEDDRFVQLIDFLCRIRGQFVVPSRKKVRKQVMKVAEYVMQDVKKTLAIEMRFFNLTTDIWTSRVMQSFLA